VRTLRFCFLNTYLLRVPLPFVPGRHLHAVPAVRARAVEIGAWLAGRHHVVGLSEVFEPDDLAALVEAMADDVTAIPGPGPRRPQAGSGLAVLTRSPAARSASTVYRERGRRLFDSDAWADKGALAVEVDGVEVVVTHLLAGGDLPSRNEQSVLDARRRRQVDELLTVVDDFHEDGRPTIVAGDFNIGADGDEGRWLAEQLAARGFVDAWAVAGEGDGRTNVDGRIDYVFVRGADVESCIPVQPERSGDAPERDALPTLSDHAALEVVLRVS
jgi:endonuclease/exonuclease/phosphatase family metal-dependent hydrolase